MSKRLQIRRGSGNPGNIFYEGEPIFDKVNKVLYFGNSGSGGTGAGTSLASAESYSAVLEFLSSASATSSGAVRFYEDTDNGINYVELKAPSSVGVNTVFILPVSDGTPNQILKTDGQGQLGFVTVTESVVTDLQNYLTDIVNDTTPQLGGDLDLNGNNITGTGNLNVTGIVTATSLSGDGSNLTSLPVPTTITVADESSARNCFPIFSTDATGDVNPKTGSNLKYDAINEQLSAPNLWATDSLRISGTGGDVTISGGIVTATSGLGGSPGIVTYYGDGSSLINLTGASAATYGDADSTPVIVVDADGRITGITTVATSGSGGGGGGISTDTQLFDGLDSTSFLRSDVADIKTSGDLTFSDNVKLNLGSSGQHDSSIYHSGTDATFVSRNGDIVLQTIDTGEGGLGDDIIIKAGTGNTSIFAHNNGAVELYHNNSKKFETTSTGITVTGAIVKSGGTSAQFLKADGSVDSSTYITSADGGDAATLDGVDSASFLRSDAADTKTSGNLTFNDNIYARFGTSGEMTIVNDGTDNHIRSAFDEDLNIELSPDGGTPKIYIRPTTSHQGITLGGGSGNPVELYHNNAKKFETTGIGVSIVGTGNTATIAGPSNLVLDPGTVGDNTGTVTVLGNLQVDGTQTVINSTTMTVDDLNITLASGAANSQAANGAGLTIDGASATFNYASSGDKWIANKSIEATSFVKTGGTSSQYLMADGSTSTGGGSGVASTITVADESSDTTCFPVFSTAATGDVNPKTGSNLTFNSSNGTLTATEFSGGGAGITGVAKLSGQQLYSSGDLRFADDGGIYLGTGYDMYILHLSSGGNLIRGANQNLTIDTAISGDILIKPIGSVELYENGSKKLETTGSGAIVTGVLTATEFSGGGSGLTGVLKNVVEDTTPQLGGNLDLNSKDITGTGNLNISGVGTFSSLDPISVTIKNGRFLYLGNSNEGSITYDAANLEIATSSGDLNLKGSGSVALYEASSKKFETTGTGVTITGTTRTNQLNVTGVSTFAGVLGNGLFDYGSPAIHITSALNDGLDFGYNTGTVSHSWLNTDGSQYYSMDNNDDKFVILRETPGGYPNSITNYIFEAGKTYGVKLYHDASKKFETTGAGVTVTGDLIVSNNARITGILTVGSSSITLDGSDNSIHGFDTLIAPPKRADTVNISVTVGSKTTANRYYDQGSGSCYFLNGVEAPFLTLTPGRTYRFTLSSSDMTNHPFRLYLEADKTTAYTTNVTSTATYTEIVVNDATPSVLHYQCSAHSLMGNSVQTNSSVPVGSGANLTSLPVPTTITVADESSDTSCNVLFATSATGDLAPKSGTNLTFNSSNGTLTATEFSGGGSGLTGVLKNVVEDTTPQLGGNLDLNSKDITGTGNANITGIVTATSVSVGSTTNIIRKVTDVNSWVAVDEDTSFSVTSQQNSPTGLYFKSDGTKMFVTGTQAPRDVEEYALSSAWDITTASHTTAYSLVSQDTGPQGLYFSPNGQNMFVAGNSSDSILHYTLSTGWDLSSTVSYVGNFSVSSQDTIPTGVTFGDSGTKMYVVGRTNDSIYQYNLSSAYTITSGVSLAHTLDIGQSSSIIGTPNGFSNPHGISISSDGTKIWIIGSSEDIIAQFNLGTAYDLSTATYNGDLTNVFWASATAYDLYIDESAEKGFVLFSGGNDDCVREIDIANSGLSIEANPTVRSANINLNNNVQVKGRTWFEETIVVNGSQTSYFQHNVHVQGQLTCRSVIDLADGSADRIQFGGSDDAKIYYDGTDNYFDLQFSSADNNGFRILDSSDSELFRVAKDGKVGINSTTPTADLDVNGHANVSGVITATSFSGSGSSLTGLTGASAATYGSSTATPVIVVDANGRITGISTVATSGSGGGGGDTVSITSTAADILSVSSGAISGDDAGADKIVFWDDSASKLTYLTVGTNLSISGTTISASGGGGSSTTRSVNRYVATNNQTLFPPSGTVSYTVGYIDVYLNGSKLDTTEFTASNGTTVTLTTGASANDIVELVAYTSIDVTNVTVVNDTSPQLGGDLDLNGNDITGTGNINITGTATVTGGQVATQNDAIAFAIALG